MLYSAQVPIGTLDSGAATGVAGKPPPTRIWAWAAGPAPTATAITTTWEPSASARERMFDMSLAPCLLPC
jgi:hypothetical protein